MKYVFFGTPRFAGIVLEGLLRAGLPPAALVCNPDRPVGRKKIIALPPTKKIIMEHAAGTVIMQPEKFDEGFAARLKELRPDFFVIAAYAKIIPKEILAIPRLGTLGVHPSLLPKYRGASPIQSAILDGEGETGTSIYMMDEKMDHGPILANVAIAMDSTTVTYLGLEEKLAKLSGDLLVKHPDLITGKSKPRTQDESIATYTKKFMTQDGFIKENELEAAMKGGTEEAKRIVRKINALGVEPGVWTKKNGARIKLIKAELRAGSLHLTTIQKEGGRPTAFLSF